MCTAIVQTKDLRVGDILAVGEQGGSELVTGIEHLPEDGEWLIKTRHLFEGEFLPVEVMGFEHDQHVVLARMGTDGHEWAAVG